MSWTNLVPQVYFDGIARFTGGFALIGLAAVFLPSEPLLPGDALTAAISASPTETVLGVLVASYLLAVALEGLGRWLDAEKLFAQPDIAARQWSRAVTEFRRSYPGVDIPERPGEALAIDAVRLVHPEAGSRLVKLRAERSLCKTVFLGGCLLSIVLLMRSALSISPAFRLDSRQLLGAALVLGLAFCFRRLYAHLTARHHRGLYNHWLLLVDPAHVMPDVKLP